MIELTSGTKGIKRDKTANSSSKNLVKEVDYLSKEPGGSLVLKHDLITLVKNQEEHLY